jgi:hypothetical protein
VDRLDAAWAYSYRLPNCEPMSDGLGPFHANRRLQIASKSPDFFGTNPFSLLLRLQIVRKPLVREYCECSVYATRSLAGLALDWSLQSEKPIPVRRDAPTVRPARAGAIFEQDCTQPAGDRAKLMRGSARRSPFPPP